MNTKWTDANWRLRWQRLSRLSIPVVPATVLCTFFAAAMLAGAWWLDGDEPAAAHHAYVPPSAEFVEAQMALRGKLMDNRYASSRAATLMDPKAMHFNTKIYPNSNSKMHRLGDSQEPLAKGSKLPPLEASGWVNDASVADGKVMVIDVWDGLCPYCTLAAPALVDAHLKYRDRDVVFIGMTSAELSDARSYVDDTHFTWPSAYGAGTTIDALQANAPTIFVVGADGRVVWNDDRARYQHDIAHLGEKLESAIEEALQGG